MTFTDRTSEFISVVQPSTQPSHKKKPPSVFTKGSVEIGKRVIEVQEKIQRFANLVSKNTLFDDPTAEIESLAHYIKSSIEAIRKDLEALEASRKKDSSCTRNAQCANHSEVVVAALQSQLKDVTKSFADYLSKRSEATKEIQKRVDVLTGTPPPVLRQRRQMYAPPSTPDFSRSSGASGVDVVSVPMPAGSGPTGSVLQQQTIRASNVSSYAIAVEKIESTMSELAHVFQNLASIVAEQGDLLDRVDAHVYESLENVSSAQSWLLKYKSKISGNRKFIVRLFLVTLLIIALFMFFYK